MEPLQKDHHSGGNRTLSLLIEGKKYQWKQQFITGLEIKQLANLPTDCIIYLNIPEPWKDELVENDTKVDLARPEIEHFYILHKLKYTIDGQQYESSSQYIRGKQIRHQGQIASDKDIFLAIRGPWEDELITDDAFVDLARPGIEHFFSKDRKHSFTIIINREDKVWEALKIEYKDVIALAFRHAFQPE